jgi:hypothetical protein
MLTEGNIQNKHYISTPREPKSRSQWPRGLSLGSATTRLLISWVRIPPGSMDVCCECCVLSGRGPYDGLITRPEESYGLCCVVVCNLETSRMRRPWATGGKSGAEGCRAIGKKINNQNTSQNYGFIYLINCVILNCWIIYIFYLNSVSKSHDVFNCNYGDQTADRESEKGIGESMYV